MTEHRPQDRRVDYRSCRIGGPVFAIGASGQHDDSFEARLVQFLQPGENGAYDLYSLGADSSPGGEGPAADIGNWDLN